MILALWGLMFTVEAETLRTLTILQTADMHGTLDYGKSPGVGRMATAMEEERRLVGAGRTLVIDCGDSFQGTLATAMSRGEAMLQAMRRLPYDVWVPGNHEYDYGMETYGHFIQELESVALSANVQLKGGPRLTEWRLFEREGVRVAVIGLQASYMPNWLLPDEAAKLEVESGEAALRRLLPAVHAVHPDVIVIAAHQGWVEYQDRRGVNEIRQLAEQFPEVDLILGAHTHRSIPGQKIGQRTWYVQPGCYSKELAVVTIMVDTAAHEVREIRSHLRQLNGELPVHPTVDEVLTPWKKKLYDEENRLVGCTLPEEIPSRGRPGVSCATSELISQAIAHGTGASVVLQSRLSKWSLTAERPLNGYDLFRLVPYENAVILADVTCDELAEIVAEQWRNKDYYGFCGIWGAFFHIQSDGHAVFRGLGPQQATWPEGQRLTIAVNSHAAAGSGYFTRMREIVTSPEARMRRAPLETRAYVEAYLAAVQELRIQPLAWYTK